MSDPQKAMWLETAVSGELSKIASRHDQNYNKDQPLFGCLCSLAELVAGKHITETDLLPRIKETCQATWPDISEKEIGRQWRNAKKKVGTNGRVYTPKTNGLHGNANGNANGSTHSNGSNGHHGPPHQKTIASDPTQSKTTSHVFGDTRHFAPYYVSERRIIAEVETKDGTKYKPVADFEAVIDQVIYDESGEAFYTISAQGKRSRQTKTTEVRGVDYESPRKLAGLLGSLFVNDPIHAEMSKHLPPAIKLGSQNVRTIRRFRRVGWDGGKFIIDGNLSKDVVCEMPEKSPYSLRHEATNREMQSAFESLILSIGADTTLPVICGALYAPLGRRLGLNNDRFAVFLTGRTGSLKTTFGYLVMSMYGQEFHYKGRAVSWKDSMLSIMNNMTISQDMPVLIDNYKPNTGGGEKALVQLIHNVVEGTDRSTMNRERKQRVGREIFCIPIITGEALPYSDMATLARSIPIIAPWQEGSIPPHIVKAQNLAYALPAIGQTWLLFLESLKEDEIEQWRDHYESLRAMYSSELNARFPKLQNKLRIVSNLSLNHLAFDVACSIPAFAEVLEHHLSDYMSGLMNSVNLLNDGVDDAMESSRFLNGLRELVVSGRLIMPKVDQYNPEGMMMLDRDRMVGFQDSELVYIMPQSVTTYRKVSGDDLNFFNTTAIGRQLKAMGLIAKTYNKSKALTIKAPVTGKRPNVWAIKKENFFGKYEELSKQLLEDVF